VPAFAKATADKDPPSPGLWWTGARLRQGYGGRGPAFAKDKGEKLMLP